MELIYHSLVLPFLQGFGSVAHTLRPVVPWFIRSRLGGLGRGCHFLVPVLLLPQRGYLRSVAVLHQRRI